MPDLSLEGFLRDLGMRIGAAAVVLGIFFGLGYVNRVDLFGLSAVLGNRVAFFAGAFFLVGVAALGWITLQYVELGEL